MASIQSYSKRYSMGSSVNGVNGVNGTTSSAASSPVTTTRSTSWTYKSNGSNGTVDSSAMSLVRSTAQMLEKRGAAELGYGVIESASRTTFIDVVKYIGNERLSALPHKGSTWDKVLMRALYFAEQQHTFEKMMKSFGSDDTSAANLGYGFCKLLLELGHENATALDKAFAVLYKYSLEVSALLHRAQILKTTPQIREQLGLMYGDLLTLTSSVATRYYKTVYGMASSKTSIDIYEVCGSVIESFRDRQSQVAELLWKHQAQVEGFDLEHSVPIKALKQWLVPNDSVVSSLSTDHTIHLGGQAEFTCQWFQKPLSAFAQGDSMVMAVTGQPGSGKSVLAASTVERLQRSLNRTSFSTLFYSVSNDTPSAGTKYAVLKSLLAQIFSLRVGNMQTYYAISRAFELCSHCTDVNEYESHLWTALEESLKKPLSNARDLIIVVDGIDEIQGGKPAGQAFFERLADTVCEGKRVKLFGLAQSLSMPSGINTTHVSITHDHVHNDIHAVILRNLAHSHNLTSKPGPEQEQIIQRLARACNASFVSAVLMSQLLSTQKTHQDFTKVFEEVEQTKPSVSDLVWRIVSRIELSPTTKTVLSWMTSAERPLSISDIRKLLSTPIQEESAPDSSPDVHSIIHAVEPLLTFTDGVVRFKHYDINRAIASLLDSGKITVPTETRQTDLLMRVLKYARTTLDEEIDPTFDEYSPDSIDRLFRQNTLLPYATRYWILHIQRLGGVSKLPKSFNKILPNVTILSLIEKTIWSLELPLPQTLDFNKIALDVRRSTLPELSPAVLQTTLNTAVLYDSMRKPLDAAPLYYSATKTSRNLLSNYHPLPVELGYRYLSVTETHIESKRTEIMTRREEVYKILVVLLEKQYGKSSTQVIEIRTMLARFYEYIHEEAHATEIYQTIHAATVQLYGKESSEAQDTSQHLQVVLGKSKPDRKIETRKDALFDEEDEEQVEEILDLETVSRRLGQAKTEREFIELWQSVSTICRNTTAVEWHERNIDIATAYSKFLSSQKRSSEASAMLSSISREYENHQVSLSEQIMSRLQQTAMTMKEFGQYSAALSILKRTSEFYQSLRREESHQYTEIQREITTLTTEMVQSDSHKGSLEDIFRIAIKNHAKPVDAKLMAIARQLTVQYMGQSEPAEAIDIIRLTLHRTWPAFLHASTSDIEMTTTFQKESVELVEFMAQCYSHQWQWDNAERTLTQLWHAAIGADRVDITLVQKVQALLINHYDRHNLPEKAITVLQQALAARKRVLGPTHDDTIKTLYELGNRSKRGPALDYFQQIVTALNKDSETCHPRAIEATIYVATTYWEDGRYADAITIYNILWNTFVQKPKEHPQFTKPEFATQLYERYVQCLQYTGARSETIYKVTTQYRSTCITIFGMQSTVTTNATLSLARICYSSEKHASEALKLYQEASKHTSGTGESNSEIKHAVKVLHTRQISNASSTSVSSETVEQARVLSTEKYEASVSQLGYSHSTTLSQLQELAILYSKQNKTEAATKELTKATTEVITKETSSTKLIEAAESIYQAFYLSKTIEHCRRMVVELRKQIVWKTKSDSSVFGFNLTNYGRSVLPFIAAMELRLATDARASFAQIMAELTTEMFYVEEYHGLKSNGNLEDILKSASRLRVFLQKLKRPDQVTVLDNDVAAIFVARDGSKIKFHSQSSARIFMTAIMQWLGVHRSGASFLKAVVLASNETVDRLVGEQKYAEAYDIGNIGFKFAGENGGYHGPRGISYGFNLASDLACVGFKRCPDPTLWKQMLQLAKDIAQKILAVCKEQDINFAQLQLRELNRLVVLLGTVEDYETLESLLTSLWNTRDAQSWTPQMVSNLGRRLICARYMAGHPIKALRLCEDIAYNMRRTHGVSHPTTRDANVLLAQLYTSIGQYYLQQGTKDNNNTDLANQYFAKAMAVHEEMLKLLISDTADGVMSDDDDLDSTGAILAEHGISLNVPSANDYVNDTAHQGATAKEHLRLLKFGYQRLGSWPRPFAEYEKLIGQVLHSFEIDTKDLQSPDKWQAKGFGGGKAESNEGTFERVDSWQLVDV